MMIDLDRALKTAVQAVKIAGERIILGYGKPMNFSTKTDSADRLTQTDLDVQRCVIRTLTDAFPTYSILAEEEGESSGTVHGDTAYRWVIDPLDGTSNFTQGLPHVGTSIALQEDGVSVLGVLSFPILGTVYTAVKGGGAFCNGEPIRVQPCARLQDAYVAEIFSDRMTRGKAVQYPPCTGYRKYGSATAALAYLAHGHIHAVALQCRLWDIAAAEILIREAGGKIEWQWDETDDSLRGPLTCIAAVPDLFGEFQAYVKSQYSF